MPRHGLHFETEPNFSSCLHLSRFSTSGNDVWKKCHFSYTRVLTAKWYSPITPLVDDARRPGASD